MCGWWGVEAGDSGKTSRKRSRTDGQEVERIHKRIRAVIVAKAPHSIIVVHNEITGNAYGQLGLTIHDTIPTVKL